MMKKNLSCFARSECITLSHTIEVQVSLMNAAFQNSLINITYYIFLFPINDGLFNITFPIMIIDLNDNELARSVQFFLLVFFFLNLLFFIFNFLYRPISQNVLPVGAHRAVSAGRFVLHSPLLLEELGWRSVQQYTAR